MDSHLGPASSLFPPLHRKGAELKWTLFLSHSIGFGHPKWPPITDLQRQSEVTSHFSYQLPTAATSWPLTINLQTGGFLGDPCSVAGLAGVEASIRVMGLPQL